MVGWHHRLHGPEFEHTLGNHEGQGKPGVLWYVGPQRVGHNLATEKQPQLSEHLNIPGGTAVKNPPPREVSSIPALGRSPGEGNGNPLQYSSLGNAMDRRAWRATAHGVIESDTD